MMGHHSCSEALFYYFLLQDQIPENHLLRLIDKHISFEFVREQLKGSYSDTGLLRTGSELQLGDELHVAGAAVAEIRIKRIRRAGQLEARTEGRGRVGKVRMVPYVEKLSSQAQQQIARDLLRFDK